MSQILARLSEDFDRICCAIGLRLLDARSRVALRTAKTTKTREINVRVDANERAWDLRFIQFNARFHNRSVNCSTYSDSNCHVSRNLLCLIEGVYYGLDMLWWSCVEA